MREAGVCAMEEKRHWGQKLWRQIESIHTAYWLWEIALAALAAWNSRRFMPHTISPTDYWLPVTVFFGTLAVLTTFIQIATWSRTKIRLWRHPPSLKIVAHSGKEASVEITHSGLATVWEAHIRILKTLDDYPNPKSILQQSYLHKEGKSFRSLQLSDGEWANITLAEIYWPSYGSGSGTFVVVPTADSQFDARVGTVGAIIEVNFTTVPAIKKHSRKQCFKAERVANQLDCVPVERPPDLE
jgi:hypothetical protein